MLLFRYSVVLFGLLVTGGICAADVPEVLEERQKQLTSSLEKVRGSVVGVSDGFGVGSGVVVSGDGIVLTASHVVDSGRRNRINPDRPITITFPDGAEYPAKVLGKNRNVDAAVLRIDKPAENGKPFPHADMGHSADLKPGDWCFALGNPGGQQAGRPAPLRIGRILSRGDRTIVSDCSIVLGDSGGPLFDMQGRVIGIHSMITMLIIENRHVAIDCYHRDWDRLLKGDRWGRLTAFDNRLVESSFFGVGLKWKDFVAQVSRVVPEGPADLAGLKPGDTLMSIDGQRFADPLDLGTLLAETTDQKAVEVVVMRDDKETRVSLTTGSHEVAADERESRRTRGERGEADDDERDDEINEQMSPGRRVGPFEKRAPDQMKEFDGIVRQAGRNVVAVRDGGPLVCFGTVMSSDGYILTKASEIRNAIDPECVLADGRRFSPRQVAVDYAFDLALLKIDATNLEPGAWLTGEKVPVGTLAVVPDARGNPLLPTVVSVEARKMANASKGFLGVKLRQDQSGVRIEEVIPGGAAARHQLKANDLILSIDGVTINDVPQMMDRVSRHGPGASIAVRFVRDGGEQTVSVTLTPRFTNEDALLPMYQSPEFQGQFVSSHSGGYPRAIQHDADIFPNQCGGPLLNLQGQKIGINIARADRVVSYAVPADDVLEVFGRLRASDTGKSKP